MLNSLRRDKGFQVSDRIAVVLEAPPVVEVCVERFRRWIMAEVLAVKFELAATEGEVCQLNAYRVVIALQKAG